MLNDAISFGSHNIGLLIEKRSPNIEYYYASVLFYIYQSIADIATYKNNRGLHLSTGPEMILITG